jgi:hypothetical protein
MEGKEPMANDPKDQPPPPENPMEGRLRMGPLRRTDRDLDLTPGAGQQAIDALLLNNHADTLKDHEQRIRDLEAFKWKLIGAVAVAGGAGIGLAKLLGG